MVSALSSSVWIEAASKAGADDFLRKPCTISELRQHVMQVLNIVKARTPLSQVPIQSDGHTSDDPKLLTFPGTFQYNFSQSAL